MIIWIILVLIIGLFLLWEMRKPKNYPPGPPRLPLVGYVPNIPAHLPHKHLRDLSEKYGPVVGLYIIRRPWVIVNSYEAVKEALLNNDLDGRPQSYMTSARTWNKHLGVLFTHGDCWQKQRRFTIDQFSNVGFGRRLHESAILNDVQDMVEEIKTVQGPFNIQRLLGVSSINVLWSIMGGTTFKRNDPKLHELVSKIKTTFQSGTAFGSIASQVPLLRPFLAEVTGLNNCIRGFVAVRDFVTESVREHKKTMLKGEVRDFIDAYLQEMENAQDESFSEEQLVALCMDIFSAGVDTSSSLISFCIFYVCLHPSVQQRCQEEIERVIGRDRYPSMEDRKNLVYVDSVYTEVFRFRCPAVTTVPHIALKDTTLQGYNIPRGTMLLMNLWAVFNDPAYWGDPGIFRPARFLDNEGKLRKEDHFFPFGKGKRACLGENLARMTTFLTFVSLLQRFSFNFDPNMLLTDTQGTSGFSLTPPKFKVIAQPRF